MLKFRRFTKPHVLKQMGRPLLGRFFDRFNDGLAARKVALPSAELDDDAYFKGLADVLMAPEGLPDNLSEALYAIDEMANDDGQERLQSTVRQAGLDLDLDLNATHADLALQVWLRDPKLLADQHNEQRFARLSSFEHYGSKTLRGMATTQTCWATDDTDFTDGTNFAKNAEFLEIALQEKVGTALRPGLSPVKADWESAGGRPTTPPDAARRAALAGTLDAWFAQHNRGDQTTRVDVHLIDGEWWFLIRHGDTFTRTAKVVEQRTEVLHFRPAKDDLVVYSPARDEIRIHAGTKGEKELYRTAFGTWLMGDDDYFSEHKAYTLEPLRTLGGDALDVAGIDGLSRIVLREYEIALDTGNEDVMVRRAKDLFAATENSRFERPPIPTDGRLLRAVFDFYFDGGKRPRRVQVRAPNTLKLGRHCDTHLVYRWLSARGFRETARERGALCVERGV